MALARRQFFSTLGKGLGFVALAASFPSMVMAKWNKKAFESTKLDEAIKSKFGDLPVVDGNGIKLKVPSIAENGSVVPVSVSTKMANVKSIAIFIENNPSPLAGAFNFGKNSIKDVSIRVRMGETSNLIALVEADGKLHKVQQEVKVTIGGCGG
jgi:sulfur-oxidizing protein SoxY